MIIDADGHFTPVIPRVLGPAQNWVAEYLERKKGHFSRAENRVTELEMLGVNSQLLNPMGKSIGLNYEIDPDVVTPIMSTYNDSMLDICKTFLQFETNIWIGLQNIPACINEIRRCLDQSFFGVYVSDLPAYGFMSDLEPLWKLIHQHNIPWYMHLTEINDLALAPDESWAQTYQNLRTIFNQRHWLISIASMIISGVLDRYPNIKIVLAERDIDWVDDFRRGFELLNFSDPLPTLKNNFWFTTEPESSTFINDVSLIGWDRVLFATDWPHDFDIGGRNSRHDVETVHNLSISQDQRQQIFYKNYQSLRR